jgi:hypothetical protein
MNNKSVLDYLRACGVPICIIETDGVCVFRAGGKIDNALAVYWAGPRSEMYDDWLSETPESKTVAAQVVKAAKTLAGKSCPDLATATEALQRAAVQWRVTLTLHATMMDRAGRAVKDIDAYLESLRKSGALAVFNGRYKRERAAATASGRGFMTYSAALARLRRLLIPIMASGVQHDVGSLFTQIFPQNKFRSTSSRNFISLRDGITPVPGTEMSGIEHTIVLRCRCAAGAHSSV